MAAHLPVALPRRAGLAFALRMPTPRQVLDLLSRNELLALADGHRIIVGDRRVKSHIVDRLETTGPAQGELLAGLSRDRLAELCRLLGLEGGGRAKAPLIARLATPLEKPARSPSPAAVAPKAGDVPAPARPRAPPRAPFSSMDQATHNKIVSFIWGIADDVLRDLFKRGKYPDVILPMCVIRRMDAVLEPTKQAGARDQEDARRGGHHRAARRALRRRGAGLLQHLEVHPARSQVARQPAAAPGRFRGLPQRLLAERPGHPRQLQVPQPAPDALQGRRASAR